MSTFFYWLVLIAYFVVILYIGWVYFNRQRAKEAGLATQDYWVAGRRTSSLVVGMSIAAGWLLIGFITWGIYNTYTYGIGGIWAMVVPWFLLLILMVVLVPWVRRFKAISQPQMLQQRYDLSVRLLSTPWNIFTFIIWSAAEVWSIANIIAPGYGVEPWVMYIVFSVPIAIYMWMGGFQSVISANVIQFLMAAAFMTIVTIAAGVVAFDDLPQGVGFFDHLSSVTPPGLEDGGAWQWFSLGIPFAFVSIIALLPGWVSEEDWWLKAQSGNSTREARSGVMANLVYNVIFVLLFSSAIGLFGLVIYPPETFAETLGGDAYQLLPVFLSDTFPTWALVPLFAFLAALSMSTVSTFTNVCALNLSYDFLQPLVYRRQGWTDERIMAWNRASSLLMVIATIIVAFMIDLFPTGLWDAYYISSGVLSAGVGVVVVGMLWGRANAYGAFTASLVGGITAFVGYFVEFYYFDGSYSPQWLADTGLGYAFVAVILSLVIFVAVSLATPAPSAEKLASIAPEPIDDRDEFFEGARVHG